MPTINFPANPQVGDTYDFDSKRYKFDGIKWTTIKFTGETAISLMDKHKAGTKEHNIAAIDWQGGIGFRNLLINGNFKVNQRGAGSGVTVPVGSFVFVSDRWMSASVGASVTCQNIQVDPTIGTGYLQFNGAAGNTAFSAIQRIEKLNCSHLVGKKATLSFSCYGLSGIKPSFSVALNKAISDDNFTTAVEVSKINLIADGFQKVTFDVPADASKGLEIVLMFSGLTSGAVILHSVQFEQGDVATPFEQRHYGLELSLCKRYYQIVGEVLVYGPPSSSTSGSAQFPVEMRKLPVASYSIAPNFGTVIEIYPAKRSVSFIGTASVNAQLSPVFTLDAEL